MKTGKLWIFLGFSAIFAVAFVFIACDDGNRNNNEHICVFGEWTQTTPPDCTSAGVKTRDCTVCGTPDTATQAGDAALGHNWVYGECERCGVIEPEPVKLLNLTFEGNTTILKAVGIEQQRIDEVIYGTDYGWNNIADDVNRRTITRRIASWTLVGNEIDGGWKIVGYYDERAIVISDGSSFADHVFADPVLNDLVLFVMLELVSIGNWVELNPEHIDQFLKEAQ